MRSLDAFPDSYLRRQKKKEKRKTWLILSHPGEVSSRRTQQDTGFRRQRFRESQLYNKGTESHRRWARGSLRRGSQKKTPLSWQGEAPWPRYIHDNILQEPDIGRIKSMDFISITNQGSDFPLNGCHSPTTSLVHHRTLQTPWRPAIIPLIGKRNGIMNEEWTIPLFLGQIWATCVYGRLHQIAVHQGYRAK